ncbi:Isochorismatase domain-containing protein 1 [Geranomyces variabilis]|uniref:Isochorismatase domain-containing protein 1 n=1 Tax=Geranomyces variabilis TaxID=109894 RepID=A0AAD5TJJ1_9FUNG|nr:Isochorismatase domain-containing protein 1 [Geranomyces variabilis]
MTTAAKTLVSRLASAASPRPHLSLRPSSTAFLCCDMQERFRGHIWNYPHIITTAQKMLDASSLLSVPFIVCEQNPAALGHTVVEIDTSRATAVIAKTKFSMLVPEVRAQLEESGRLLSPWEDRAAVLFGIESHVCVLQTALDLIDSGFRVVVLADGVSSMNKGEVQIALARLAAAGATVATSESILFQLLGDASHARFKEFAKLTKKYQPTTNAALDALVNNVKL